MSQNINYAEIRAKADKWGTLELVVGISTLVMIVVFVSFHIHGPLAILAATIAVVASTLVGRKASRFRHGLVYATGYRDGSDA